MVACTETENKGVVDASKKATNVPARAVATAIVRQIKTIGNQFYMLCVRLFLLMNTCYTKHHPSSVDRCTTYNLR